MTQIKHQQTEQLHQATFHADCSTIVVAETIINVSFSHLYFVIASKYLGFTTRFSSLDKTDSYLVPSLTCTRH